MKTLALKLAVAAVVFNVFGASLIADDEKQNEKGVPPGLQKKGGLPPGQAKKRGNNTQPAPAQAPAQPAQPNAPTTVQAKEAPTTPTPAAAPAQTPPKPAVAETATPEPARPAASDDRDLPIRQARLQDHVSDLDIMGAKPDVREKLVTRLNKQGIPLSRIEAQQKAYPAAGIGSITVANLIARTAKVPADQLLAEHKSGKGWGEIAHKHHVYLKDMNEALAAAKAAAR